MVKVLDFTDIRYVRDGRAILDGINWQVNSDERWVILGPNGAGKSTLMSLAAAREYPSSGAAVILDRQMGRTDVTDLRTRVGFVSSLQARRIPAGERVLDAVLTAAWGVEGRWIENYDGMDVRQAERVLAEWDLAEFGTRRFGSLSDGERKRVLIARAVMSDPELLLLDEPASSLDLGARERLLQLLSGFASSPYSPAMVMVTHHVEEIPPGFTHGMLVRGGKVTTAGPLGEVLTAESLSETFGMSISLRHADGRYAAVAA